MDGVVTNVPRVEGFANNAHRADAFATDRQGPEQDAVTLMLRDGSRLRLLLAEPMRQVTELAAALAPISVRPDTITLDLEDGSRLMLRTSDILGLRLPPERPALIAQPATGGTSTDLPPDTEVLHAGKRPILRVRNFLAPRLADELYRFALSKRAEFKQSSVISNDPEYRKSVVLYSFPGWEATFRNVMSATLPQLCDALAVPRFDLAEFECQMTATFDRGYFKPHSDNANPVAHRQITYVYYFHRQPKPFTGGDIRLFDFSPFAPEPPVVRHLLDVAPAHNSIIFFPSDTFHEVRETICNAPAFENARFTLNGWLGLPKDK